MGKLFILFFGFVVFQIIKGSLGGKKPKTKTAKPKNPRPTASHNPINRSPFGHMQARQQLHKKLHAKDIDMNVFTPSHANRVKSRDQRAQSERGRLQAISHSMTNKTIIRSHNQGLDSWGQRGDKAGLGLWPVLIVMGMTALFALQNHLPDALRAFE